jgi:hypothetical protein
MISLRLVWSRFRSLHVLVQVGVALLAAMIAIGRLVGTPDPDSGTAHFVNDEHHPVQVWRCASSDCRGDFPDKATFRPGEVGVATVSIRGVPNVFLVLTLDGQRLGCLPFVFPEPRAGVVARIAQRVRCQDSYDNEVAWPPV